MQNFILEACVDSVESAQSAAAGGATRLELCANLVIGGTTPSPFLLEEVRRITDLPVHILIRPRFGDFCYTEHEFQIIKKELRAFRSMGADGVVIGILRPDGTLFRERLAELLSEAGELHTTLHRAFDICIDPKEALEDAIELGFQTVLTSGQKNVCTQGIPLLRELMEQSAGRIQILVGSGVNAEAIRKVYPKVHAMAYHMSGKLVLDSSMQYRKEDVTMGLPSISEYEIWRAGEANIREARQALEEL